MKNKVFKYVRNNDEGDGSIFEGAFQLPDDGCPDSDQFLRVRVVTHEFDPSDIVLDVVTKRSERRVVRAESREIEGIAAMLYGTARIEVVKTIQPV